MSDNRDLERRILKALQRHQAGKHNKRRWIFSIIAGLFVTIVFSKCQTNSPRYQQTSQRNKTNYSSFKFPRSFCGDKSAGGTGTWYPVYIDYSESNLRQIRQLYCCDAAYDPSVNKIIVASFYNPSKANQFVALLKSKNFRTAYLGYAHRITISRTPNSNNCR